MMREELLRTLAAECGVEDHYYNIWGQRTDVSLETQSAILDAMGHASSSLEELRDGLYREKSRKFCRLAAPLAVAHNLEIILNVPPRYADSELTWTIVSFADKFTGAVRVHSLEVIHVEECDGERIEQRRFLLPQEIAIGYYDATVTVASREEYRFEVLVPAPSCAQPDSFGKQKTFGVAAQLYSLRSNRNWGIGDFHDLSELSQCISKKGGALLGVNPLHALFASDPSRRSPYAPNSRYALSPLYLDVEDIVDFQNSDQAQQLYRMQKEKGLFEVLRASDRVDYDQVSKTKMQFLRIAYEAFERDVHSKSNSRAEAFRQFMSNSPQELREFCAFETLQKLFSTQDPSVWGFPCWPVDYRDPNSSKVKVLLAEQEQEVRFHWYLQWLCHEQLCAATIGKTPLYGDIALCAGPGGAETWANQKVFAHKANAGAPPDEFNIEGQDWGAPPWNPHVLWEQGYRPFRRLLRTAMQYCSYLRLDHVMSLQRLYWVGAGMSPKHGAYVRYPLRDLAAIVAHESSTSGCAVIGEDLGTVPDEVREEMHRRKMFSYKVIYFMRGEGGRALAPEEYPESSLATVSTHDLPTVRGYWEGHDIEVRHNLGIRSVTQESREAEKKSLLKLLAERGLLSVVDEGNVSPHSDLAWSWKITQALHRLLAQTKSHLAIAQMEDLMAVRDQVNLPGTVHQHPNWVQKLPAAVEEIPPEGMAVIEEIARTRAVK